MRRFGAVIATGRNLLAASVGIATLGLVSTASALPILSFDLNFTQTDGPPIDITGSFSIDGVDFTGVGFEQFGPNARPILLTLDVVVDPDSGGPLGDITFAASDDIFFDAFPVVRFLDGVLTEVDFATDFLGGDNILIGLGPTLTDELDWIFVPATGAQSSGTYNALVSVPEPATLALFGIGLAGLGLLGWHVRRRERRPAAPELVPA